MSLQLIKHQEEFQSILFNLKGLVDHSEELLIMMRLVLKQDMFNVLKVK